MDISIIIPTYNQQDYLNDCIDSVLAQTVKPHEIIIVNDGSTDNTKEIAESYKEVKVVNQTNRGLSSARNTGIMNATGTWILPLDSDDILKENAIERLQQEIKQNNYDDLFNENGADVIGISFKCFGLNSDPIILMKDPQIEDFKVANRIGYCSLIKRSVLLEVGGYSAKMVQGYEDLHLWFTLMSRGKKIKTIQDILWLYRVRENSMISDSIKHHVPLMTQIAFDFPEIFPDVAKAAGIKTPLPK